MIKIVIASHLFKYTIYYTVYIKYLKSATQTTFMTYVKMITATQTIYLTFPKIIKIKQMKFYDFLEIL